MSKILVTGINGFVGGHLAEQLAAKGNSVVGVGMDQELNKRLDAHVSDYYQCDLSDTEQVRSLPLANVDGVINLAGLAAVGLSFDDPELYMRVNTSVLRTICDVALEQHADQLRILAISSGAVYSSKQAMPLTEESLLDPQSSPYSASKIAMEEVAQEYRDKGVDCLVARPFNHIGPGQMEGFLLPDLYAKVTKVQREGGKLLVGNLTTKRDYTDVRDVANAYIALMSEKKLEDSVFNVCSGRSVSGEQVLGMLLHELDYDMTPEVDESQFRPSDAPDLYGDNSRLNSQTGWFPSLDIRQTIADFVASKT